MVKIHYGAVKELFKVLEVNPDEFRKAYKGETEGWFPEMPERVSTVDVKELARVIANEPKPSKWRFGRA